MIVLSNKSKSLKRSQAAHNRLMRKHRLLAANARGSDYNEHFIKQNYHSLVYTKQHKNKRKLSLEEKKRAYSSVISDFF